MNKHVCAVQLYISLLELGAIVVVVVW